MLGHINVCGVMIQASFIICHNESQASFILRME